MSEHVHSFCPLWSDQKGPCCHAPLPHSPQHPVTQAQVTVTLLYSQGQLSSEKEVFSPRYQLIMAELNEALRNLSSGSFCFFIGHRKEPGRAGKTRGWDLGLAPAVEMPSQSRSVELLGREGKRPDFSAELHLSL